MVLGFTSTFIAAQIDYHYILALFFGTLSVYSLHRWFSFTKRSSDRLDLRKNHILKLQKALPFIAILSFLPALFFYFTCSYTNYLWTLPVILLTAAYLLPLFWGKRIRDLSYIKIWIVSFSWAWLGIWIPMVENHYDLFQTSLLFIAYFLFIFALILPMDFRDRKTDLLSKTYSISNKISLKNVKFLGLITLALSMFAFVCSGEYDGKVHLAYGSGLVAAVVLTLLYDKNSSDLMYSLYFDGTILLQGLFLYITSTQL